MATATKIQLVEFNKDKALNGASLAFSSNGQLSAVSVSEVPVRVTNMPTVPSEPVSITGTVSVDNFPSSGT